MIPYTLTSAIAPTGSARARILGQMKQPYLIPPAHPAPFRPREIEILRLLVAGEPRKMIAHKLGITPRTVHNHLTNARERTGCHSTLRLAVLFALADSAYCAPGR